MVGKWNNLLIGGAAAVVAIIITIAFLRFVVEKIKRRMDRLLGLFDGDRERARRFYPVMAELERVNDQPDDIRETVIKLLEAIE